MKIWNAFFDTPPAKTPFSEHNRRMLERRAHLQAPAATSPASSSCPPPIAAATWPPASSGASAQSSSAAPPTLEDVGQERRSSASPNRRADGNSSTHCPTASTPSIRTTASSPPSTKSPRQGHPVSLHHRRPRQGRQQDRTQPVSTDGIVPYWSSHLDGAESELIVPSGHWSNQHPPRIAEVKRILLKHLGKK